MENYVGKRLDGRYEIQDVIGVGGMAVVYKAYDNIDDRIVAVKILKDEYLANEEFRRRFKNESKAIAVLSHPNIVKVYDVSFGDRLQYIVMEYIEGITLKEYIEKRGTIDWNEALYFIIQVLRALQHAHDKGIVHRDIKPQNIMLLEDATIKVADFGIARFSHSDTRTITEKAIGSVHYMSPEQAKGELTDEKSDIYSVGTMLYEMLTGTLPFDADSAVSVALMQVNSEPELPRTINPDIPLGFEQITMKAMQKNPRDRYQSSAEMLVDLEELRNNPNVKFDYQTYYVDKQPTKYIGKIQEKTRTIPVVADEDDEPVKMYEPKKAPAEKIAAPVTDIGNEEDYGQSKKNTKTKAVAAGIGVAVVAFAVIIGIVAIVNNLKKVEVDSFVGMNYEKSILNNPEYDGKYTFETYYASFTDSPEGSVFDQDPKAGTKVEKGAVIKLYIAKSGDGQIIPDFTGKNYKEAKDTLERMGFTVEVSPIEYSSVTIGQVVRTSPEANSSALAGSKVTVYYSADTKSGKEFKMPDLEGKSLEDAKKLLEKNGLNLSKVETANSTVAKDYVLKQSPASGVPVSAGENVVLTVSTGTVSAEKTINLPQNVGVVSLEVKTSKDSSTDMVDTNSKSTYTFNVTGTGVESVKVYLNGKLYYEATVDFSKEPAKFSKEKTHNIDFYTNVVGMTETIAVATLNQLGYTNVTVRYEESNGEEGIVLNQSPSQSSAPNLDKTATIILTVCKNNVSDDVPTDAETVEETEQ
ncbi:MAG: Stk1 family PASTA domain-containing Ser/Thr kinase [Acutalibacteraceae bacterium]